MAEGEAGDRMLTEGGAAGGIAAGQQQGGGSGGEAGGIAAGGIAAGQQQGGGIAAGQQHADGSLGALVAQAPPVPPRLLANHGIWTAGGQGVGAAQVLWAAGHATGSKRAEARVATLQAQIYRLAAASMAVAALQQQQARRDLDADEEDAGGAGDDDAGDDDDDDDDDGGGARVPPDAACRETSEEGTNGTKRKHL